MHQPSHYERWRARYELAVRRQLKPRPRLTGSEWASRYRFLAGVSAEKGPYSFDRAPYLREITDAITEPGREKVVVRKPSRVGFTEGPVLNGIGYYTHQDPSSILIALPTVDDAETFSKAFLAPMFEATPELRKLLPESKGRDQRNTILRKEVGGEAIELVGSNSPRQVRMRGARFLVADEVDGMAVSSGKEGDFLGLFYTRADNYADRKILIGSSPGWKGVSRIDREYLDSDQRRFFLCCPKCGVLQELRWGGRETAYGIKWPTGAPAQAFYLCEGGCQIVERQKPEMYAAGYEWRADNPGHPTAGFSFNRLVSMFPGAEWPRLAARWVKEHPNSETRQVFVNTVLAESYEEPGERVAAEGLAARREVYPAEVPAGVGVLTCGVDVHPDRLEVLVNGWGAQEECWRILHTVIVGDLADRDVQETLDAVLFKAWHHEGGGQMRIRCTMIDSGDQASLVYSYVKPRQRRNVFASKGDRQQLNAPIVVRARKPIDAGVKLATIGTFNAKRHLFSSLRRAKPGPRFKHYGVVPPDLEHQDVAFFQQYEAEKFVMGKDEKGRPRPHYEQVADRNEAIDLEVGALAALRALGPAVYERLEREVAKMERRGEAATRGEAPPDEAPEPDPTLARNAPPASRRPTPRKPGGWMRWR